MNKNNQNSSLQPPPPTFSYPGDLFQWMPQEDFEQLAEELRGVDKKNIYVNPCTGKVTVKRRALTRFENSEVASSDIQSNQLHYHHCP